MAAEHINPDDIRSITVGLHQNGMVLVGAPLPDKRRPRGIVQGQFSMPFATAVALLRGSFGWDDYELLGRPETDAICDRVEVVRDESLENAAHPFGASLVVVTTKDSWRRHIANPSGEPATFPSRQDAATKFLLLTRPVLGAGADDLLDRLRNIPEANDVGNWFREGAAAQYA
jgi:2-methylcitrate dehydratase PrpD